MTCETALDRMLEAEPEELRGEADTELARHIRACPRCRRTAGVLTAELAALDTALDSWAEEVDPDAAADAALAAIRDAASVRAMPRAAGGPPRGRRRTGRLGVGIGLAAAAVIAGLLLWNPTGPTSPPPPVAGDRGEAGGVPSLAVTPPPGRSAAVLQTRNPEITVIWLYDREES